MTSQVATGWPPLACSTTERRVAVEHALNNEKFNGTDMAWCPKVGRYTVRQGPLSVRGVSVKPTDCVGGTL
jgi:hypothetical protein